MVERVKAKVIVKLSTRMQFSGPFSDQPARSQEKRRFRR
jgi:hypothetical protein